ncbi:Glycosyl transferase family 2 [Algoriphagus locisalis]|uniref:Glycosyl transferase family 2 n=1 Tax=Algoriphagus locisalis TaxID=305507 RepID=A0A1I6XN63_9BACT|nr:glycosyltransferase family A protein [Algoriphagus locisalis]SFT39889.1 Glycosyl transferase family 2 [Algoriphagus locisalis]
MFSVIIPVYNKKRHLSRSIDSVLNQSFPNFELILVDDASTDGSFEFISNISDQKVSVFRRSSPGAGGYAARNLGIEKAKYSWVCFLDADDEWEHDYLESMRTLIAENGDVKILSAAWRIKNKSGSLVCNIARRLPQNELAILSLEDFLTHSIANAAPICSSVAAVQKEVFEKSGTFPANQCNSGGDVDTWLRILLKAGNLGFFNKVLATYFVDSDNMVTKNLKKFEIGCIMKTIKQSLETHQTQLPEHLLKKYSNKYLLALIAKTIRADQFDGSYLSWYYKEVDYHKYLIFKVFNFRPLRMIYKFYLIKRNPFHG